MKKLMRQWCDSVVDVLRHYECGGELEDKQFEKVIKILAKFIKNQGKSSSGRVENRGKSMFGGVWGALGAFWGVLAC